MTNKHPKQATFLNKWYDGNHEDGKHYWLTPPALMAELQAEFHFDFDPCPYPIPPGFDGLSCEWGQSNYANIPFGSIIHHGKKKGPTAWAKKAIAENQKGKRVVFVYPIDKWVLMMLAAGAKVRNLGDVRWCATEDGSPGKGTGRHIAAFILSLLLLCSCTGPRYDYDGNGTGLGDRAAMSLGKVINKQRPPSRFEHSPEEYRNK